MNHVTIAKIIQVACLVIGIALFFVLKGNVKWFVIATLAVALVAHFYDWIMTEVKVELGKVEKGVVSKL